MKLLIIFTLSILEFGCVSFHRTHRLETDQGTARVSAPEEISLRIRGNNGPNKEFKLDNEDKNYIAKRLKEDFGIQRVCFDQECSRYNSNLEITFEEKRLFPESGDVADTWYNISFFTLGIIPFWARTEYELKCIYVPAPKEKVQNSSIVLSAKRTMVMHLIFAPFGLYRGIKSVHFKEHSSAENDIFIDTIKACVRL